MPSATSSHANIWKMIELTLEYTKNVSNRPIDTCLCRIACMASVDPRLRASAKTYVKPRNTAAMIGPIVAISNRP